MCMSSRLVNFKFRLSDLGDLLGGECTYIEGRVLNRAQSASARINTESKPRLPRLIALDPKSKPKAKSFSSAYESAYEKIEKRSDWTTWLREAAVRLFLHM